MRYKRNGVVTLSCQKGNREEQLRRHLAVPGNYGKQASVRVIFLAVRAMYFVPS